MVFLGLTEGRREQRRAAIQDFNAGLQLAKFDLFKQQAQQVNYNL